MQRFDTAKMRNIAQSIWARRHELPQRPDWLKLRALVVRQRLSAILMLIGVGILGYVGSEYWAMYHEQNVLQREWQEQQKSTASTKTSVRAVQDDSLTRVSIPKINLDVIVVEGTNHRALRVGPGHLKRTPAPGEVGNSVI